MSLLIICLVSFLISSESVFAEGSRDYFIDGIVYSDPNKNALREGYEVGVGGVKVTIGSGQSTVTGADGKFKFQFKSEKDLQKIFINENSIPAGAVFTTPAKYQISEQLGVKRSFSFGIFYNPKIVQLENKKVNITPQVEPLQGALYKLEIVNNKVHINDKPIQAQMSPVYTLVDPELADKVIHIPFDLIPLSFSESKFKQALDVILSRGKSVKAVEIVVTLPAKDNDKSSTLNKASGVAEDLWLKLFEKGVSDSILRTDIRVGEKSCQITVKSISRQVNKSCKLHIDSRTIQLKDNEANFIALESLPNVRSRIVCPKGTVEFISPWSSTGESSVKISNAEALQVKSSEYVSQSQDLDIFFEINSQAKRLNINGQLVDKKNHGYYPFVFNGKEGVNKLELEEVVSSTEVNKYEYTFPLYMQSKFQFDMRFMYTRKDSKSDVFKSNYIIPSFTQVDLEGNYLLNNNWQLIIGYKGDVIGSEIDLVNTLTVNEGHSEVRVLYGKTYRLLPNEYKSFKYSIYAGIFNKTFNPGNKSVLFYGEDTLGWMFRSNFIVEEVFPQIIDLKVTGSMGSSFEFSSQLYRLDIELYLWLNKLGSMLGMTPEYIFYDRFKYFHNMKLITGISVEYNTLQTANYPASKTNDWFYALTLGLQYSF